MNIKTLVTGVFALATLTCRAEAAVVSTDGHSPDQVQGKCTDTYFGPNKSSGVYGCLNSDGSGIVCGGKGQEKNRCYTWGASSRRASRHLLPTTQSAAARMR